MVIIVYTCLCLFVSVRKTTTICIYVYINRHCDLQFGRIGE